MSDVKVAIAGACGRMGHELIKCASKTDGVTVVGAVEYEGHESLGKDAGELAGVGSIGVEVVSDVAKAIKDCDVLIDFTLHDAVPGNMLAVQEAGKAAVIGTTGLTPEETAAVNKCAEKAAIVWAPNMSLGVNMLFAAVKKAGEVFGPAYSVEIDETHHVHKKDAPSGTALRLGEKAAEGLGVDFGSHYVHDENGEQGIKDPSKIVIRSHREGEVVGDHTVSFESHGERIEFTHNAWSREAFAAGAMRAAKWVVSKGPGLYDMQDVMGL